MKKLIIFGTSTIAEVAYYYFSTDTNIEIAAFTVTAFHDITLAALNFVEQVQYTALV